MRFNSKRFISVFLALFISVFSILSCTVTVRADNLFTYAIDAVKLIRELFGAVGDVATGSYDFGTKIAKDVANLMNQSQDTATDYGVIYNDEDKNFYFKQDSDNNVYISQNFYNVVYDIAEKYVRFYDGYYLLTPAHSLDEFPTSEYLSKFSNLPSDASSKLSSVMTGDCTYFEKVILSDGALYNSDIIPYCYNLLYSNRYIVGADTDDASWLVYDVDSSGNLSLNTTLCGSSSPYWFRMRAIFYGSSAKDFYYSIPYINNFPQNASKLFRASMQYAYGEPIRVFYSLQDLKNFLGNGRHYVPKIKVNNTIKLPREMFDNASLSNKINEIYNNLDISGKAEADIQADLDLALKNYLDSLFGDINPSQPTSPTPTPSGGGSGGDFGDGVTPTPTPSIGDGSDDSGNGKVDLTETNSILKDILKQLTEFKESAIKNLSDLFNSQKDFFDSVFDWLTSFSTSHTKFEKTITDYIEANDGKLDQIIDAIDKLSQGKEDGEDYKCKYDYTELSDYLKKLWNDSDKKFDTMIDLLEENNEYQQKLVDTLDSIKSILIKESIMDSFKDRSKETANKAKEKFPTSVPWDIAIVINAMSATPEEPKFNLPIKIASLNIDENIEVDLSSGEWEKLAKTCRYMLSLLFILFMVQLSRKLFFNKGDDN